MSVNGKVGIVTGAGSGLGEASAKRLAREGAKLIVADRDQHSAERVAAEIHAGGGDATPLLVDVSAFADTRKLVDTAVATYGQLDLAFNNAGITPALIDVHEIDPAASKHGIVGLTRTAAVEYATRNIRINAVAPGPIDAPSAQRLPPDVRASIAAKTAMNRTGTVEEVASVVHFLLSEEASFVTGAVYEINGGQTQL